MSDTNAIIKDFEQLRFNRWDLVKELMDKTSDYDELLADIANLATLIYVARKMSKQVGFESYGEPTK